MQLVPANPIPVQGHASHGEGVEFSIDGVELLANLLDELASHAAQASLDHAMQEACESFCRDTLEPEVQRRVPRESGDLANAIQVFPQEVRSGGACEVGLSEAVFDNYQGDLQYAGFQEFGWKQGKRSLAERSEIEGDGYLRGALYDNEAAFERHVERAVRDWVRKTDRLQRRRL